jgi:hypothetical protein
VARTIELEARSTDVIVLAQASMANAAELVKTPGVQVLSSPKLGLRAALSMYRELAG